MTRFFWKFFSKVGNVALYLVFAVYCGHGLGASTSRGWFQEAILVACIGPNQHFITVFFMFFYVSFFFGTFSAKYKMLHFMWFLQYIVAMGSVPRGQEGDFKRRFWWPAWVQITFRCFMIKRVKLILKYRKVVCIHAGHQNHLLKRPVREVHGEPRAHICCKNHIQINIWLLDSFWIIFNTTQKTPEIII